MTVHSLHRGHAIQFTGGYWRYSDTGEATEGNERTCGHCGKGNTPEGHDGCLGTLPGVKNACCGHGEPNTAYAMLVDGRDLRGQEAMRFFASQRPDDTGLIHGSIPQPPSRTRAAKVGRRVSLKEGE